MNESTKTKKALRGSLFALFLCIVLLIGTTFAWFTDSVSTGVNKIQAGNLDVELEYSTDCENWQPVDKDTTVFEENVLYEPGFTQVTYVRVKNAGNLALNYSLASEATATNGRNQENKLYKIYNYLMMGASNTETAYANRTEARAAVTDNAAVLKRGVKLAGSDETVLNPGDYSKPIAVVLYMPETVGNEANPLKPEKSSLLKLNLVLNATQAPVESDSFDNQYDKNAANTRTSRVSFSGEHRDITGAIHADGGYGVLDVQAGGSATVNADIIAVESNGSDGPAAMAVWADGNGTSVVIDSGNFTQKITGTSTQYDLIYASNRAQITINGGTFKCETPKWTLNCLDNTGSKITVNGGRFYKFNPATDNPGEVVLGAGCTVTTDGDWYVVSK